MSRRALLAAEILVLLLAAWQVWEVVDAIRQRFASPFDLEWMEGATLISALRTSQGLPFYTAPSADYIPFIYPPLYAWTVGTLGHLWPVGYELGRGVSIVATVVATVAIALGALREGARPALAVGCAALFVGCYEDSGTFYDLVRTDALAMALAGLAIVVSRGPSRASTVAGGLLLAVAFAAKHHAAMFGFPLAIALGLRDGWKRAGLFALASAGPALAFAVAMQIHTDGLFLTYLLGVPAHHGMVANRLLPNISDAGRLEGAQAECWRALPITTTLALLVAWRWPARAYWGGVAFTALLTVSLMRGHTGGYLNVLMPMMWVQALFPALMLPALSNLASSSRPALAAWAPTAVTLLVALQIAQGRRPLAKYIPRPSDAENALALVEELRALPEPMLVPHAPWLAVMAGKQPSFALITLWDINHEGGPLADRTRVIKKAMASHHWSTIVVPDGDLGFGLRSHYRPAATLKHPSVPTRTGWKVTLKKVYVPDETDRSTGIIVREREEAPQVTGEE